MNEKFERDYPRYVGDEMPEKERREFERQVVSDPEFAEEMYADLNVASKLERGEVVKLAPRWWRCSRWPPRASSGATWWRWHAESWA